MTRKDIEKEVAKCIRLMKYDIDNQSLDNTEWNMGRIYGLEMALEIIRGKKAEEVY